MSSAPASNTDTASLTMLIEDFFPKKPEVTSVDPVITTEEPGHIPCFYSISSCLPSPVPWAFVKAPAQNDGQNIAQNNGQIIAQNNGQNNPQNKVQTQNNNNNIIRIFKFNDLRKSEERTSSSPRPKTPREIIHIINVEQDLIPGQHTLNVFLHPVPAHAEVKPVPAHAEIKPIPPARSKIARVSPMISTRSFDEEMNNNNKILRPETLTPPARRRACCDCECGRNRAGVKRPDRTKCNRALRGSSVPAPMPSQLNQNNNNKNANHSVMLNFCSNKTPEVFQKQFPLQMIPPPIQPGPPPPAPVVTISRKRLQNLSMKQMNSDLLAAQLERKEKLGNALLASRSQLSKLKTELALLRGRLQPAPSMERLKEVNQRLQIECDFMAREVDLYTNGDIPLGETSEQFYNEINPGQDANELLRNMHFPKVPGTSDTYMPLPLPDSSQPSTSNNNQSMSMTGRRPTGTRLPPPPRPPPPRFLPIPPQVDTSAGEWFCSMCTFKNHPDLNICEQCSMVRVKPPSSPIPPFH